ncbi:uncharacterized protein [Nothobranchius furzeri]|uniref:uncharacterized protein isoform X1 n=1 Tax=Nothobranchius furzeri TaxID=105023 RepID=UPI002403AD4E|nr:uncharacterized protein LOC129152199 isoform X1 [Nothobranchius furzeri]
MLKPDLRTAVIQEMEICGLIPPAISETDLLQVVEHSEEPEPAEPPGDSPSEMPTTPEERKLTPLPVTLPRYEPPSPTSALSSLEAARLQVRLARVKYEAQEKARQQDISLELKRLELEAETKLRLRKMELDHELQMLRENTSTSGVEARSADTLQTDSPPDADRREVEPPADERNPDATERRKFDVGKCIALVPTFRETEVDSFFSAFERLAAALDWPREVWSLVLQCKLSGKAQVVSFKWTTAAQGAFENCKLLLCSAPVLKAPDLTRPFKLEIDASDVGMGAVLLQEDEGALDHPVSYFSKKFAKYQLHYSTVEKETLALVLAIQHFEVYLYPGSNPIVVYTDHNPLVFLSRMYNKNQRLMRWALLVQDYDLHIQHKKGTDNIVADSLSMAF